MYALRSQPEFNPMQTTLFKRAHTGTCMDNGYDLNSMAVLSKLFKLNSNHLNQTSTTNDDLSNANQNLMSNLVANGGLSSNLLANQTSAANLFESLNTSAVTSTCNGLNSVSEDVKILKTEATASVNDNRILDKIQALTYYQQLQQMQDMPTTLFNVQNSSSSFDLAAALDLLSSSSTPFSPSSVFQSLLQTSIHSSGHNAAITTSTAISNATSTTSTTQSSFNRAAKRQKTIPNPIQLTYSNFKNEQNQPLDLSVKSASSTNSERFILEPLNLSRSNSPQESIMEKPMMCNSNNNHSQTKVVSENANLVVKSNIADNTILNNDLAQIQNALCKKKKVMLQRAAAELLKKSSCSSAPCSPSSIATSSSPSDQPFDLDTSQSNLEICLTLTDATSSAHHSGAKKRKFSDSAFSLDSQATSNSINSNLPKLKAKRRQATKSRKQRNVEETIVSGSSQQTPNTIIIDAKNTFTCSICGEMFAFKDRLSKHIKSKHRAKSDEIDNQNNLNLPSQNSSASGGRSSPNQRNYQCPICSRGFSRSDMLTRHSRVHSGLKPYTCNICNSEFTRSDHLATHKRTHSGEKPYKCSKCTYTACRRDMITRHMKTHMPAGADKNSKASNSVVLLVPASKNSSSVSSSSPETIVSTSPNSSTQQFLKSAAAILSSALECGAASLHDQLGFESSRTDVDEN